MNRNFFSEGILETKWKSAYCRLYEDSSLFWYKAPTDATSKGNLMLKVS